MRNTQIFNSLLNFAYKNAYKRLFAIKIFNGCPALNIMKGYLLVYLDITVLTLST